jgi:hypothetical protein
MCEQCPPSGVRFRTFDAEGNLAQSRVIQKSSIVACPHLILVADHYRADGTCRCNESEYPEMEKWGYEWSSEAGVWV